MVYIKSMSNLNHKKMNTKKEKIAAIKAELEHNACGKNAFVKNVGKVFFTYLDAGCVLRDVVYYGSRRHGLEFEVLSFNDGTTAIRTNTSYDEYSLALIDLMLPDMSGMEIIKAIRQVSNIPIIIITAKDNDTDKSLGLNLGADDYVVKPFSLIELAARIKANIRRARTYQVLPSNSIVKIKDIEIDPQSHMVTRKGTSIDLTPIEFELLYLLASHPGQAYSKERLYELIWKEPYFGNENVLNTHINRLRLKLKNNAEDTTAYIKTLWGIGYKMEDK